jgi:hypothetical protein
MRYLPMLLNLQGRPTEADRRRAEHLLYLSKRR